METFEIIAEPREDMGKGASRRLRREGKVPGIVYGAKKDAASIMVKQNEIMHHLEDEAFYSHILTLQVGFCVSKCSGYKSSMSCSSRFIERNGFP